MTDISHLYAVLGETFATILAAASTPSPIREAIYSFISDIQGAIPCHKLREIQAREVRASLPEYLAALQEVGCVSQTGSEHLPEDLEE